MTAAPATRSRERVVDGVRLTIWAGRVENERTVPDTRLERRTRQVPRWVQVPEEHHHEEYRDGRWERTHTTTTYKDEQVWEDEEYSETVPWDRPIYDVRVDGGGVMTEIDKGSDVVGAGDTIIMLSYLEIASGRKWARWLNASTRTWMETGRETFRMTPAVGDAALRLRTDLEAEARGRLRGRTAEMRPFRLDGDVHVVEGVVRRAQGVHAVIEYNGLGVQDALVHPDWPIASGDLVQAVARVSGERVLTLLAMDNPADWTHHENEAAITSIRRERSPRRQHAMAGAGLAGLVAAYAGMAAGWPALAWGIVGIAGGAAALRAALERRDADAMAAMETAEIARLRRLVQRGRNVLADWNWRRIRDGI